MAGPITISIVGDVRDLVKGTDQAQGRLGKLGKAAGIAGKAIAAGLAGAAVAGGLFLKSAVSAASDAQQSIGATETVFGKYASTVIKTSNQAAQQFGLSANEYRENANLIASLFKNQGVSMDQLAGKTKSMIGQASDLAATFGGTTKEAVEALGSAFKGEFDPLEKYGISLKQSTINAYLAAHGQANLTGAALKAAQQQATTAIITKQAAAAQGAFGRESDTLAHQQQVLGAQWENIKATIGGALLPVLTQLGVVLNTTVLPAVTTAWQFLQANLGPAFAAAKAAVQQLTGSFGGGEGGGGLAGAITTVKDIFATVVATIGPIVTSLVKLVRDNWGSIVEFTRKYFTQARSIISDVLELIRAIVQKWGAVVRALWDRFGADILHIIKTVFKTIAGVVRGALDIIQGVIKLVTSLIKGDWSGAWDAIKQIVRGAWEVIKSVIGGAVDVVKTIVKAGFSLLADAVKAGVGKAVDYVKSIPGRIVRGLGDLGGLLYDAGRAVIQGLISGIGDMIGNLIGKLGEVTDLIPDWKGPLDKDRRLLRPAGQAIMGGLIGGIADSMPQLRGQLRSLTREIGSYQPPDITTRVGATGIPGSPAAAARNRADLAAMVQLLAELLRAIRDLPVQYQLNERANRL